MHSTLTVGLQIDPQKHRFSTISGSKLPSIVAEANKQHSEKKHFALMRFNESQGCESVSFLEEVHLGCRFCTSCTRVPVDDENMKSPGCIAAASQKLIWIVTNKQTKHANCPSS